MMTTKKTKIIVAESQELFRKGLVALLKTNSGLEVTGDASNGRELIELLKQTTPDLVLLDKDLPIMDGRAVLAVIQRRFPELKVIILSDQSNAQLQSDFMGYGANSFISKDTDVDTLIKAINAVKSDGFFFNSSISRALLSTVLKDRQRASLSTEISFNERETEIIKKICDGLTNKEIAINLHLSASTIDFYRSKIYGKTKCNNVAGLLKYALRNGLVELT